MPNLNRIWIPSPNYNGSRVRDQLLVIHTAEGATNFRDLGAFFSNSASQVSAHVGIDDTPGEIGEYLHPDCKAWAAFSANDWGEHAELCGFAAWTREEWMKHGTMLKNTHKWLKEEGEHYGIPLVKLSSDDIRAGKRGVCGHKDLTDAGAGGDHWDPGTGFPWDVVLGGGGDIAAHTVNTYTSRSAPIFPGRNLSITNPFMTGTDVSTWQKRMRARGWKISVDGIYGVESSKICRQFQTEKGLSVDGVVGPTTWRYTWEASL